MRPSRFAASLIVAGTLGFVLGRCTAPSMTPISIAHVTPFVGAAEVQLDATVAKVVDGDTVALILPNTPTDQERIRLLAVDTPERGQLWYHEARDALAELVEGRTVRLEFETGQRERRDKYGRLLAYLLVDDRNVNVEMIRLGWSPYVSKYGGERYHGSLVEAEEEARAAHRGIWSSRP